jgi:hypothetical protein
VVIYIRALMSVSGCEQNDEVSSSSSRHTTILLDWSTTTVRFAELRPGLRGTVQIIYIKNYMETKLVKGRSYSEAP